MSRSHLVVAALVAAAAFAGCSDGSTHSSARATSSTAVTAPSLFAGATTTTTTLAAPPGTRQCTVRDLEGEFTGTNGAGGTIFVYFDFRNKSASGCVLRGTPPMRLFHGVSPIAVRVTYASARQVVYLPAGTARIVRPQMADDPSPAHAYVLTEWLDFRPDATTPGTCDNPPPAATSVEFQIAGSWMRVPLSYPEDEISDVQPCNDITVHPFAASPGPPMP